MRQIPNAVAILDHTQIPLPSHPGEWCFDQLKDAALLILEIQQKASRCGFALREAKPEDVQFLDARPIFTNPHAFVRTNDHLWRAYAQFCECFFAPLALMSYGAGNAHAGGRFTLKRLRASLPARSYLKPSVLRHVHLRTGTPASPAALVRAIQALKAPRPHSGPSRFYDESLFERAESRVSKLEKVRYVAADVGAATVFDLGANAGVFARALAGDGRNVIAFDADARSVNQMYLDLRSQGRRGVLPLHIDVERGVPARKPADLVLCLALTHQLRFSANLSFARIANLASALGRWLLIEFVPPEDAAVLYLRGNRATPDDYSEAMFLAGFRDQFAVRRRIAMEQSNRILYLFEKRSETHKNAAEQEMEDDFARLAP